MFSGSNTCDTILFIPIHHTIIQLKRVLPSFLKQQRTLSIWYYLFHVLVCALYKSTFYHFAPYVLRRSPPNCLTEITLKPGKKKILCCKVRPLVSISEMRQKKFFIAVCISGIWDLLYIHLSHTGNPIKLLAFSAIQNIAVLSFFFF